METKRHFFSIEEAAAWLFAEYHTWAGVYHSYACVPQDLREQILEDLREIGRVSIQTPGCDRLIAIVI